LLLTRGAARERAFHQENPARRRAASCHVVHFSRTFRPPGAVNKLYSLVAPKAYSFRQRVDFNKVQFATGRGRVSGFFTTAVFYAASVGGLWNYHIEIKNILFYGANSAVILAFRKARSTTCAAMRSWLIPPRGGFHSELHQEI